MKVIEYGVLSDGTKIQLESWGKNDSELVIAAYPIAQRTCNYWIRGGEIFRLQIGSNQYTGYTDEMVRADYLSVLSGEKTLYDLSDRFWNEERDKWCLGMYTDYKP